MPRPPLVSFGHAQTLDHLFVNGAIYAHGAVRAAHINADWPAEFTGDGSRGSSDHDPQVARFRSRASLSVADSTVVEGDQGTRQLTFTATVSRPLSQPVLLCAATVGVTARAGSDFDSYAGCKLLAAGQTAVAFPVTVRGDRKREADERLTLLVAGCQACDWPTARNGNITDDGTDKDPASGRRPGAIR